MQPLRKSVWRFIKWLDMSRHHLATLLIGVYAREVKTYVSPPPPKKIPFTGVFAAALLIVAKMCEQSKHLSIRQSVCG